MKKALAIAGIIALTAVLGQTPVLAKGNGGMHGKGNAHNDGLRSLARADKVAGTHGLKGRNVARTHGANSPGFCPPGQQKKLGSGSRFAC